MRIQLFPLHTVLAPGIALPLHVFEERYRRMVTRCLDASEPFGIVLIHRGREVATPTGDSPALALADVGTFAEIREASLHPDGRWDLLVVGSGRFRVTRLSVNPSWALEADVEPARKQALLEAATAEDRLRDLDGLLDREIGLLRQRLALFVADRLLVEGSRN